MDTELHRTFQPIKAQSSVWGGCRVQGVWYFCSFSAQFDSAIFLNAPPGSAVVLRPRFAYILDQYGHARSPRRASARHVEVLYRKNNQYECMRALGVVNVAGYACE